MIDQILSYNKNFVEQKGYEKYIIIPGVVEVGKSRRSGFGGGRR